MSIATNNDAVHFSIARFALIVIILASALPLLVLFARGIQIFDIAHEFVAYRIGDALSLNFGMAGPVRPVQGLSTALISKVLTKLLYFHYGKDLVAPTTLQLYSALFFTICGAVAIGIVAAAWLSLSWPQRTGIAIAAIAPWYLSPLSMLVCTPEYWFGEYVFIVASLALLPLVARSKLHPQRLAELVGAWVGLGVATKVSMIGIAPLFFLALPRRDARAAVAMAVGAGAAYGLIVFAYAGFRQAVTVKMLAFQALFYLQPNASYIYPDGATALSAHPAAPALLALAAVIAWAVPWRERLAAWLWLALYGYLIVRRPHDTSLASAMLGALFVIGYCAAQMRTFALAAPVALVAAMVVPQMPTWLNRQVVPLSPDMAALRGDILYVPNNDWNPYTPLWAFAVAGGLGLKPVTIGSAGQLKSDAPVLHMLFGETFLLRSDENDLSIMRQGLARGMSVAWFRHVEPDEHSDKLMATLTAAQAHIEERRVLIRGTEWVQGTAITKR